VCEAGRFSGDNTRWSRRRLREGILCEEGGVRRGLPLVRTRRLISPIVSHAFSRFGGSGVWGYVRQGRAAFPALVSGVTRHDIERTHPHLSKAQRYVVEQILASRDRVVALEGVAGAGKTTTLTAIRAAAE
jgi:AAA domain